MKVPSTKPPKFLNRYTSLPVLIDMLRNKHLVLLDPKTWEDRNDAFYIERYKEEKEMKSVLALCFSSSRETFHHWKVFSSGVGGVCVEFDGRSLVAAFESSGIRCKKVVYKLIKTIEKKTPKRTTWPYLKRRPYRDEREFRAVYETKSEAVLTKSVQFELSSINRVTLSPWLPKSVADSVIFSLKSLPGCGHLKVYKSSLLENSRWKRAIASDLQTK